MTEKFIARRLAPVTQERQHLRCLAMEETMSQKIEDVISVIEILENHAARELYLVTPTV